MFSNCARSGTDGSTGEFFSSLMMLCCYVLHVLKDFVHWNCCIEEIRAFLELLEFEGRLARQLRFHLFNSWNLKDASHDSFVFIASTLGIRRMPRTTALFSRIIEAIFCAAHEFQDRTLARFSS